MDGGNERKPGDRSLVQDTFERDHVSPAAPGKRSLTQQLTPALQTGSATSLVVQRKASSAPGDDGAAERDAPRGAATPLDALTERLTPAWASAIAAGSQSSDAHDEELKAILLGAFEANWFKAKDCLLFDRWPGEERAAHRPRQAASRDLMQALVNMRTRVCNEVVKAVRQALPERLKAVAAARTTPAPSGGVPVGDEHAADLFAAEANDPSITPGQHAKFHAPFGAQKRTSDIDVPISGRNPEIAMQLFNETFRAVMKVPFDAATVFDYNVYAQDWMFEDRFVRENVVTTTEVDPETQQPKAGAQPQQVATRITPTPEHVISGSANDPERNAALQQDRAKILDETALLHIRRNCSDADWQDYTARRIASAANDDENKTLRTKLRAVDLKYKQFAAAVRARAQDIERQMGAAAAALAEASAWGQDDQKFQRDALETRAANELYTERMLRVKDLRLQYSAIVAKHHQTAGDIEQLTILAKEVTKALGDAGYFANEKYASEGATLHTVIGIQKARGDAKKFGVEIDVVLTRDQYMQSFHENVGDSLYSIEHYKQDPPYATYRVGKYIDRMLRAARALCGDEVTQSAEFQRLNDLASTAADVKSSDDGDDPAKIAPHFATASPDGLEALKRSILAFGAAIPARAAEHERLRAARPDEAADATPPGPGTQPSPTANPAMQNAESAIEQLRDSVDAADEQGNKEGAP
jgi:hypothetical protein